MEYSKQDKHKLNYILVFLIGIIIFASAFYLTIYLNKPSIELSEIKTNCQGMNLLMNSECLEYVSDDFNINLELNK